MLKRPDYMTARALLMDAVEPVGTEWAALSESGGRILAQDLIAVENVPPFDRSPYDGYALRAADTAGASGETPVTLRILEEVPAGSVPTEIVTEGSAVKILTGAPIPQGADAVINYERTSFTGTAVTVYAPLRSGENIIRAGEDVRCGGLLACRGDAVDPGIAGTLASQGIAAPSVYQIPKVGILSTGSELVEVNDVPGPGPGKIRNSNRHTFEALLKAIGCEGVYLGTAGDSAAEICGLIREGLRKCSAIVITGGVSAGDYDLTPDAMEMAGVELLFRGAAIKPGMACAYGVWGGKPVCGLSGSPASALTNFYAIGLPALRKLMGCREPLPRNVKVTLSGSFGKKSPVTRFLRGKLELKDGRVCMALPGNQGNAVLSSVIGCDVMAVVPAGSGPLPSGTELEGFLL